MTVGVAHHTHGLLWLERHLLRPGRDRPGHGSRKIINVDIEMFGRVLLARLGGPAERRNCRSNSKLTVGPLPPKPGFACAQPPVSGSPGPGGSSAVIV